MAFFPSLEPAAPLSANRKVLWATLFVLAAYPLLFLHLEGLTIRNWDEARLAVNATEMTLNGQWLAYTYGNEPDMWNTKPPLMIWSQALCIKALGANELSIRLPAALAGLFTGLLLLWFGTRWHHPLTGFVAGLTILMLKGVNVVHVFRTGDFDAFLVLFNTATVLFFFEWMQADPAKNRRWAVLTALALMLGIMSKGVAAILAGPAMLLFLLLSGKTRQILFSRNFLLAGAIVLVPVLAYYLGRESINPGYLQAVWENELGGRFGTALENHIGPWNYYLDLIWTEDRWYPVVFGFPALLAATAITPRSPLIRLSWYLALTAALMLVILSAAKTKLGWYEAPIYPLFALACILPCASLLSGLATPAPQTRFRPLAIAALMVAVLGVPYSTMMTSRYFPQFQDLGIRWGTERMGYCLRQTNYSDLVLLDASSSSQHDRFYLLMYQSLGRHFRSASSGPLAPGDKVLFTTGDGREWLNQSYEWEVMDTFEEIPDGTLARIIRHK